jgi:plasmid maintenance system antidote protein VapI
LSKFDIKSELTKTELQQLMLKHRLSINEVCLKTSIPRNDIQGYLNGRKTITTDFVDRINQIGEDNGRQR